MKLIVRLSQLWIAPLLLLAIPCASAQEKPLEPGFVQLFDGKTLEGWEGNRDYFRVEQGAIVAGTLSKKIPHNEFLCTQQKYADFELRLEIKLQ